MTADTPWDAAPDDDGEGFYDDAPGETTYGIKRGRYQYPSPPGYVAVRGVSGFMRTTRYASAFSDQIRLQLWRERMIMLGLRTAEGEALYDELMAAGVDDMAPDDARAFLEGMADKLADAAGAGLGARRGTARHTMLQVMMETGVLTGSRTMRLQLHSLMEALERHHLEPIPGMAERVVCNTTYGIMGTLDLGVRCRLTGQIGIMDLKTQRSFWSYLEIAGQQLGYDSAPWIWRGPRDPSGGWVEAPQWNLTGRPGTEFEGRRVALLAHMPQAPGPEQLPVEIHEVALDFGTEVMQEAGRILDLRSRGKSVARGRRVGALRALPKIQAGARVASRAIAD